MPILQHLVLVGAVLAMSVSGPLTRLAVAPAVVVVMWRVVLASPVVWTTALVRRERWSRRGAIVAGLFLALHWLTWVLAIQRTTIASASLLTSTGSLWAAVLSRPVLGEPVARRQWAGLGLALVGIGVVLSGDRGGRHSLGGDLCGLACAACWVAYTFIGRRVRQRAGFWGYLSTVYLAAGLLVGGAAVLMRAPLVGFAPMTWLALVALALLPTLVGHGGFNYLLRYMGPARLGLWVLSEPVLAALMAWGFFGEAPTAALIAGGSLTLSGVALGATRPDGLK